jgi:hypothetical protein
MIKLHGSLFRGWFKPIAEAQDSLDAFGSERPRDRVRSLRVDSGVLLVILVMIAAGGAGFLWQTWRPFSVQAASGSLTIESDPAGAEVFMTGVRQGKTPLTLAVTPGVHAIELVYEGGRKALSAVARAGAAVVHHVELDPVAPSTAALRIVTEPARLRVRVDGKPVGRTPLTAENLRPGAHKVEVIGSAGTIERKVELRAGENASVIISAVESKPSTAPAGWLVVTSPVPLQLLEGREVLGTSLASRIMIPAGRHELRLANDALGISLPRVVEVKPGAVATIRVEVPRAPLSINALPWAEAWIDGVRVGETPIGNHLVTVGTHDVVFRHPEFGERRQTVTVSLKAPARVSVDMRKPQ